MLPPDLRGRDRGILRSARTAVTRGCAPPGPLAEQSWRQGAAALFLALTRATAMATRKCAPPGTLTKQQQQRDAVTLSAALAQLDGGSKTRPCSCQSSSSTAAEAKCSSLFYGSRAARRAPLGSPAKQMQRQGATGSVRSAQTPKKMTSTGRRNGVLRGDRALLRQRQGTTKLLFVLRWHDGKRAQVRPL